MRHELFYDLFRHMEWADALIWNVTLAAEGEASRNEELLRRLRHIHLTEHAFLTAWRGGEVDFEYRGPLEARSLMAFARTLCSDVRAFVESVDESRLEVGIVLPWAHYFGETNGFDPAKTTLFDTFYQLCAHGVHHRAQINTRLRDLGIIPPLIDYIAWAWRGRPDAVWPER